MSLIGTLVVSIVGDNKAFKSSLIDSKKQLSSFGGAVQKHSAAFMKTGAVMMGFAGAICIAAIKVGKEFDKAYSKIRTGTGKTGKVLEGLKKDFRAVAKDVPNSLDEVSIAIADLNTRLGLTGKPLQAMAKQMLNLARITDTDVNAVIRTSTRLFGDWDVAVEDQAETLDYLYKVSQSTGVGIDKLSDMVTTYGVQLRTVGFTMEESLALMGKWEKEGVSAEKMLGGLSMALGKFAKAQKEPEEAFRQLVQQIEEATTVGEALELGVEALGTRAGPDFALAVREGRFAVEDFVKELDASLETINQAALDTMTLSEMFDLLKNRGKLAVEPLARKLTEELLPVIEKITDKLGDLDDETLDNIASNVLWATKILAIGGAFIFAMGAVGKLTKAIKTVRTAYISFDTYVKGSFFAGFLIKWGPLLSQIGVAIGLMSMQIHDMERRWGGAEAALEKFKEASGGFFSYWSTRYYEVSDNIQDLSDSVKGPLIDAFLSGAISADVFGDAVITLTTKTGLYNEAVDVTTRATEEEKKVLDSILQGTYELTTATIAETVAKELGTDATTAQIATTVDYENAIAGLMAQYGFTREQAEEYYNETEEGTEIIEDQEDAVDNLRSAFSDLIDTLFGITNAENDLQEAEWKLVDVEKELQKLREEGKEGTREYEEKINDYDDALQDNLKSLQFLYTEEGISIERKEELRLKLLGLLKQAQETSGLSQVEFVNMAQQFGLNSQEIIGMAAIMGIKLDEATKERLVDIDADTVDVDKAIKGVTDKANKLDGKVVTITFKGKQIGMMGAYSMGGIASYLKGGIAGSDGFSLPILTATQGLITLPRADEGMLAVLHPPELVLNPDQALRVLWKIANEPTGAKSSSIQNTFYISELIVREEADIHKIAEDLYDLQETKQRGMGYK